MYVTVSSNLSQWRVGQGSKIQGDVERESTLVENVRATLREGLRDIRGSSSHYHSDTVNVVTRHFSIMIYG